MIFSVKFFVLAGSVFELTETDIRNNFRQHGTAAPRGVRLGHAVRADDLQQRQLAPIIGGPTIGRLGRRRGGQPTGEHAHARWPCYKRQGTPNLLCHLVVVGLAPC